RRHVRDRLERVHRQALRGLGLDVQVVPLHAGDLAGLAADAGGRVDEHADLVVLADGGAHPGGGDVLDLEAAHYAVPTFSSLTRKVLYSGVWEFGSTTLGVSRFAIGPRPTPLPTRPMKPQWIGIATYHTVLPVTFMARRRRVTSARPSIEPRGVESRTRSSLAICRSFASPSGISTKNSGCSAADGA